MPHLFFVLLATFFLQLSQSSALHAVEASTEACLKNVRQLTFPSMGLTRSGEAYFSPDSKMIIFQAIPKGEQQYQIFTLNIETNEIKMVSTGLGSCTCSFFHPEGKKIIFASSHSAPLLSKYKWQLTPYMNIYEANVDGSGLVPLTEGPAYHAECAYSSDGRKIVYASNEDGSMNIYTMDADGRNKRQLTHTTHCYNGGPFFSPDDQQIVFRADRAEEDILQIYLLESETGYEKQLTANKGINWAPYWHPSGRMIAYTAAQEGSHCYDIYLYQMEKGETARLTYGNLFDGLPSFNGAGDKILWTSKGSEDGSCQIFMADFFPPF